MERRRNRENGRKAVCSNCKKAALIVDGSFPYFDSTTPSNTKTKTIKIIIKILPIIIVLIWSSSWWQPHTSIPFPRPSPGVRPVGRRDRIKGDISKIHNNDDDDDQVRDWKQQFEISTTCVFNTSQSSDRPNRRDWLWEELKTLYTRSYIREIPRMWHFCGFSFFIRFENTLDLDLMLK